MMTYEIRMTLAVDGGPDLAAHFESVTDEYYKLELADDLLLDSSFGFGLHDAGAEVDVELTVCGADPRVAYAKGASAVRTAIHAAGGSTPSWDEPPTSDVRYVFSEAEEPEPLDDVTCVQTG